MLLDEYAENLLKPCRPEAEFQEKIHFLEIQLSEKNKKIENLTEEVNCKKNIISDLKCKIENAKNEIFQLKEKIKDFEKQQIIIDDNKDENFKSIAEDFEIFLEISKILAEQEYRKRRFLKILKLVILALSGSLLSAGIFIFAKRARHTSCKKSKK